MSEMLGVEHQLNHNVDQTLFNDDSLGLSFDYDSAFQADDFGYHSPSLSDIQIDKSRFDKLEINKEYSLDIDGDRDNDLKFIKTGDNSWEIEFDMDSEIHVEKYFDGSDNNLGIDDISIETLQSDGSTRVENFDKDGDIDFVEYIKDGKFIWGERPIDANGQEGIEKIEFYTKDNSGSRIVFLEKNNALNDEYLDIYKVIDEDVMLEVQTDESGAKFLNREYVDGGNLIKQEIKLNGENTSVISIKEDGKGKILQKIEYNNVELVTEVIERYDVMVDDLSVDTKTCLYADPETGEINARQYSIKNAETQEELFITHINKGLNVYSDVIETYDRSDKLNGKIKLDEIRLPNGVVKTIYSDGRLIEEFDMPDSQNDFELYFDLLDNKNNIQISQEDNQSYLVFNDISTNNPLSDFQILSLRNNNLSLPDDFSFEYFTRINKTDFVKTVRFGEENEKGDYVTLELKNGESVISYNKYDSEEDASMSYNGTIVGSIRYQWDNGGNQFVKELNVLEVDGEYIGPEFLLEYSGSARKTTELINDSNENKYTIAEFDTDEIKETTEKVRVFNSNNELTVTLNQNGANYSMFYFSDKSSFDTFLSTVGSIEYTLNNGETDAKKITIAPDSGNPTLIARVENYIDEQLKWSEEYINDYSHPDVKQIYIDRIKYYSPGSTDSYLVISDGLDAGTSNYNITNKELFVNLFKNGFTRNNGYKFEEVNLDGVKVTTGDFVEQITYSKAEDSSDLVESYILINKDGKELINDHYENGYRTIIYNKGYEGVDKRTVYYRSENGQIFNTDYAQISNDGESRYTRIEEYGKTTILTDTNANGYTDEYSYRDGSRRGFDAKYDEQTGAVQLEFGDEYLGDKPFSDVFLRFDNPNGRHSDIKFFDDANSPYKGYVVKATNYNFGNTVDSIVLFQNLYDTGGINRIIHLDKDRNEIFTQSVGRNDLQPVSTANYTYSSGYDFFDIQKQTVSRGSLVENNLNDPNYHGASDQLFKLEEYALTADKLGINVPDSKGHFTKVEFLDGGRSGKLVRGEIHQDRDSDGDTDTVYYYTISNSYNGVSGPVQSELKYYLVQNVGEGETIDTFSIPENATSVAMEMLKNLRHVSYNIFPDGTSKVIDFNNIVGDDWLSPSSILVRNYDKEATQVSTVAHNDSDGHGNIDKITMYDNYEWEVWSLSYNPKNPLIFNLQTDLDNIIRENFEQDGIEYLQNNTFKLQLGDGGMVSFVLDQDLNSSDVGNQQNENVEKELTTTALYTGGVYDGLEVTYTNSDWRYEKISAVKDGKLIFVIDNTFFTDGDYDSFRTPPVITLSSEAYELFDKAGNEPMVFQSDDGSRIELDFGRNIDKPLVKRTTSLKYFDNEGNLQTQVLYYDFSEDGKIDRWEVFDGGGQVIDGKTDFSNVVEEVKNKGTELIDSFISWVESLRK